MNQSARSRTLVLCLFGFALLLWLSCAAQAQTTTFTYQGRLTDSSMAANGTYDFQFALFDAATGGTQQPPGSPITVSVAGVQVTNGVFTVQLDFGAGVFPGADRYLQISVKKSSDTTYTTLMPRQQVTSVPYTIRSLSAAVADTATNSQELGGVAASQYVQTNDTRLTNARPPTAGSSNYIQNRTTQQSNSNFNISGNGTIGGNLTVTGTLKASLPAGSTNYIQNTTTQQASSNFNISGNGTAGGTLSANTVNAVTQYNLNGSRILSEDASSNLFAGVNAGSSITTGNSNSFFGYGAGQNTTTGGGNSFVGYLAGNLNTMGRANSFLGYGAGLNNTTGSSNSFLGSYTGLNNTTGSSNSFVGTGAGAGNTTGGNNSFLGYNAGNSNKTGSNNSFFGYGAGQNSTIDGNSFFGYLAGNLNTTGNSNAFFGYTAGQNNTTGGGNSFFGYLAGTSNTTSSGNAFFGYTAGQNNTTGGGNSFVGASAGVNNTTGTNNSFLGYGAGNANTMGGNNSFVGAYAGENTTGSSNSFVGTSAGFNNTTGGNNSFFGYSSGSNNTTGAGNTFIGYGAGLSNTTENNNTFIGFNALGITGITNATAIGANSIVTRSNSLVLGSLVDSNNNPTDINVGIGTASPIVKLHVVENSTYHAARFEGSNPTGTWMELNNTGTGGHNWAILSAASNNSEGAGNLVITDETGGGRVVLDNPLQVPSCTGCTTAPSDRNLKANFAAVNSRSVLERVAGLPILSWNYRSDPASLRHIGPMAQDFYAAFGVGGDDKHINLIDEGGVALTAIQELYRENLAKDKQIEELKASNAALEKRLAALESAVEKLSQK